MSHWPGRLFAIGASRCACDMRKASLVQRSVCHSSWYQLASWIIRSSRALEQLGEFKLQFDIGLVPLLGRTRQLGLDFRLGQFRNLGKRASPAPDESQSSSNWEIHVDDQGLWRLMRCHFDANPSLSE